MSSKSTAWFTALQGNSQSSAVMFIKFVPLPTVLLDLMGIATGSATAIVLSLRNET